MFCAFCTVPSSEGTGWLFFLKNIGYKRETCFVCSIVENGLDLFDTILYPVNASWVIENVGAMECFHSCSAGTKDSSGTPAFDRPAAEGCQHH